MKSQLLFLCTGNYYRSRFAEILFNHLAANLDLRWRAASRGIAIELGVKNIGPISPYVLQRLRERRVVMQADIAPPLQLQEHDLRQAGRIIALYEQEHRPLLQERFPTWMESVEFWNVPDVHLVAAQTALAAIEERMQSLITELSATKQ